MNAIVTIEHSPQTGIKRPFELYFQADGGKKHFSGSFATQANALARAKKIAKSDFYAVTIVA